MLAEKLRQLRKQKQLTQVQLAERLRVTQQAVAKWEAGLALPEPATIAKLADIYAVSSDFLLGITDMAYPASPFVGVRIIGAVRAGYDSLAEQEDLGFAPAAVRDADQYRYLLVKGDSMSPYIRAGDLALVRIQPSLNNGELGVMIYRDGEATLKKYYRDQHGVRLVPFNDAYETITIAGPEMNDLFIFGKVVETVSKW